jgi:23S rRNA (cytosine1962-C5)-methyltransferase
MDLVSRILRARDKREPLLKSQDTTACRLFHGAADGLDGLVIERFNDVLVMQVTAGHSLPGEHQLTQALERLRQELSARAVYRKVFVADRSRVGPEIAAMHLSTEPWLGEPVEPEIIVQEHALRFIIRPYDGFSVGLFLEHRDNRRRVTEMAAGRRVLNLFSYTCSFSVAAAYGSAVSVASVDLSRRYLEWGKRNFQASGLLIQGHRFYCSDVLDFYSRARRQKHCYDMIILDPPTFARARRPHRTFVLDEQIREVLSGAIDMLEPGGILLLGTNARHISVERLEREVLAAAGPRGCTVLDRPALPLDFVGDPDYSKTVIAKLA